MKIKNNQRLALVAVSFTEQRDGVSVYIENFLAQALRLVSQDDKNIHIDVYSCGKGAAILQANIREYFHGFPPSILSHVTFIKLSRNDLFTKYVMVPIRLQKNGPYDRVILPNLQPLFLPGMKVFGLVHDLTYKRACKHFSIGRKLYLDLLTRFRIAADATLGYISQSTKKDLFQYYSSSRNKHMIHVPNGLPFKMIRYARPCKEDVEKKLTSKTLRLLFVGRINRLKGFDLVIAACRRLDQYLLEHEDISIIFHVVGKRTLEAEALFNSAKFERVDLRVHGYVNDDMLNQLYRESAFCFFLSQNEGFGLPLLESAWFRCIPVLSNIPVFREIMGQDYPLFLADLTSCEAIVEFIHRTRSSQSARENVLEMIERVVETHRDGYERAAHEVLDLSCTKKYSKQVPSIG